MSEINIKVIGTDDLHKTMVDYIKENKIKIQEYEEIKECVLKMIREGYLFNVDRDRLRDAMEDITYMYSPNDDLNKDRVNKGLEYEYSDEEEISDDEDNEENSEIMDKNSIDLMSNMMRDPAFGELLGNLGIGSQMDKNRVEKNNKELKKEEKCDDCPKKDDTPEEEAKEEEAKEEEAKEEVPEEEAKEEVPEEEEKEEAPEEEAKEEVPEEEEKEEVPEEEEKEEVPEEEAKEEAPEEEAKEEAKEEEASS